jgi:hypothetical protein
VLKIGTKVKTLHAIYAGPHKDQVADLTRLAPGTVGIIKHVNMVPDDEYYLVRFTINQKRFWAKLNIHTMVAPV